MKLITTLYTGDQIEVTLMVQSRNSRNKRGEVVQGGPMITRYKSKIGNESLIFNPSIALFIRGREQHEEDAMIPLNLIYRFMSILSGVYQQLSDKNLYHQADGTLFIDQKTAVNYARKITLFRNSLVIVPSLYADKTGKLSKGIDFTIEGRCIASVSHVEALGIIDLIEHLDIGTYSLMAGVIDELEVTNQKVDRIENAVIQLLQHAKEERVLLYQIRDGNRSMPPQEKPQKEEPAPTFQWQSVNNGLFQQRR